MILGFLVVAIEIVALDSLKNLPTYFRSFLIAAGIVIHVKSLNIFVNSNFTLVCALKYSKDQL